MIVVPLRGTYKGETYEYKLYVSQSDSEFYSLCECNKKHGRVFYCDDMKKIKIIVSCKKDSMSPDFLLFVANKLVELCNGFHKLEKKIEKVFYCRAKYFLGDSEHIKVYSIHIH